MPWISRHLSSMLTWTAKTKNLARKPWRIRARSQSWRVAGPIKAGTLGARRGDEGAATPDATFHVRRALPKGALRSRAQPGGLHLVTTVALGVDLRRTRQLASRLNLDMVGGRRTRT